MSFLAKLRHKNKQRPDNTQICYLFSFDYSTHRIKLHLALSKLQQGRVVGDTKPYLIQRQHLVNPPAFLSSTDQEVLQILLDSNFEEFDLTDASTEIKNFKPANSINLQRPSGEVKAVISQLVLNKMLSTQRGFVKNEAGFWQQLALGEEQIIAPHWLIDNQGRHSIQWRPTNQAVLLTFDAESRFELNAQPETNLVLAFDRQQFRLSLTKTELSESAAEELKMLDKNLAHHLVADFIAAKKQLWTKLGLPLPQISEVKPVSAKLAPLVSFYQLSAQSSDECCARLVFRYMSDNFCCEVDFMQDEVAHSIGYWDGVALYEIIRKPNKEKVYFEKLASHLKSFNFSQTGSEWTNRDPLQWSELLLNKRDWFSVNQYQMKYAKHFPYHYVFAKNWKAEVDNSHSSNIQLNLSFEINDRKVNLVTLMQELHEYNQRHTTHNNMWQLADGRWLVIPFEKFSGLLGELADLLVGRNSSFKLPKSQFSRLANLSQQLPDSIQWSDQNNLLELALSLHETPVVLDNMLIGVKAQLRPYQWLGVCWLQHLKRHSVSGLLADDMGLGKTLQTLVHLNLEKRQQGLIKPALIIAPTSLLHNWASEIKKFTPELTFKIMYGQKRQEYWQDLSSFDIVITSYQLILNDLADWEKLPISWLILDEAQQIKNVKTQISQAVRKLDSEFRIGLSGTPVENHLGELWSVMDFLMPNILGSLTHFKRSFQQPIENNDDQTKLAQLQQRIAPFVLRRTKQQVATDLPARTEIYQSVALCERQMAFYKQQIEINQTTLEKVEQDSQAKSNSQIHLLTALLKLRQACCDPQLLGNSDVPSAKRIHCIDMIEQLVAEKRFILVFSQFTSMLDLLAKDLTELKIPYFMLTGKTRDRAQLVADFQQGKAPVFLISLKAGGVGLNLTQADTVIHFDPWWNSAAEQQASDRAHRIGQDKPVFIYKLIAENTIEERIAALQQHKFQLSEHINQQAQLSGEKFALKLEDLMALWQQESKIED